jgi:hypothetical protein
MPIEPAKRNLWVGCFLRDPDFRSLVGLPPESSTEIEPSGKLPYECPRGQDDRLQEIPSVHRGRPDVRC